MPLKRLLLPGLALLALIGASTPSAAGATGVRSSQQSSRKSSSTNVGNAGTGGAGIGAPSEAPSTPSHPTVPGDVARIIKGVAYAPSFAPQVVKEAIWAGNHIRTKPYIYGGGHGSWQDAGYDCSGSDLGRRVCPVVCAAGGQGGDLGREPHPDQALHLRGRPRQLAGRRL